jgi:hypothetical protein
VQVTLKGEVFYVSQVTTVGELQERLLEESGLDASEQGSVTFQGKVLESTDSLSKAGMKDGDQINMVPKRMADHWKMMQNMGTGLLSLRQRMDSSSTVTTLEERKDLDVMTKLFEDLMKVPYMQEEMERFSQHLKNPLTFEHGTDPERVESLRQIILNNPLLTKSIAESKASSDALLDPDAWFRYVQAAMEKWRAMDGYQLWQRLIDGKLFGGDE